MIECCAVELLRKQGIRELPEIRASLEKTPTVASTHRCQAGGKLNRQSAIVAFRVALVEAASNSCLIHISLTIMCKLIRYQLMYHFIPGVVRNAHASHGDIRGHIQNGDYDKDKEGIRGHIKHFVALLEDEMGG
jgi:DNA-binding FadR family transcriptional regulator